MIHYGEVAITLLLNRFKKHMRNSSPYSTGLPLPLLTLTQLWMVRQLSLTSFHLLHIIDVCLPALFLPTNPVSSRALVYNPRAHSYFHPPGSLDARVSQPPSIFKLPPVQANVRTFFKLIILLQWNPSN